MALRTLDVDARMLASGESTKDNNATLTAMAPGSSLKLLCVISLLWMHKQSQLL